MQTSPKGITALEDEEGVVLKAYRCPAGVLTIGVGITNAAGVIKITPGMVITRAQATNLLQMALRRNYEPRVLYAMTGLGDMAKPPKQHEFDAGVSFDFNTGAIKKASWLKLWLLHAPAAEIRAALGKWNKGGGKVLPGLVSRRAREANMLLSAVYPKRAVRAAPTEACAAWGLSLSSMEKANARAALRRLGYQVGDKIDGIKTSAVKAFQKDHDLTVDGIIGRATLSTLQRRIDGAAKAVPAVVAPAAAAAGTANGTSDVVSLPPSADWIVLAIALAFAAWTAWRYRDVIAAKINPVLPRVAAFLRSI